MASCDGVPLAADIEEFIADMAYVETYVETSALTATTPQGRVRRTLAGIDAAADARIAALGFVRIEGATFETGAIVPDGRSLLLWATADGGTGFYYYFSGEIPSGGKIVPPDSTPASTGGTGDGGWLVIDDLEARLGDDASSVLIGAVPASSLAAFAPTMQSLLTIPKINGRVYRTASFHTTAINPKLSGGRTYVWSDTKAKNTHDGGTVIDPDRPFPTNWSDNAQIAAWLTAAASGEGCFVLCISDGVVDVNHFGAVDSLTQTSVSSHLQINKAFLASQALALPLKMYGNYYTNGQVTFSNRLNKYYALANGSLRVNLNSSTDVNGLYVGDDSSNGIYPMKIEGLLNVQNIGTLRASGKYGFHVQSAAYGYYNVVANGWDIGQYLEGVIYATVDGKNEATKNNNLDMLIETNQGVQGGLRHTNNLLDVRNMILGSQNKLALSLGSDAIIGIPSVGGSIVFTRVLFEDKTPAAFQNAASIIITKASEVNQPLVNKIKFNTCWFEVFDTTKPLFKTDDSQIILDENSFIANPCDAGISLFDVTGAGGVYFRDTTGYFGDGISDPIVNTGGSASVRSRIYCENSKFFGPAGQFVRLHDGNPANLLGYVESYESNTIGGSVVYRINKVYISATDDFMTNGTLDFVSTVQQFFGSAWSEFTVNVYGYDGVNSGIVRVKGVKGAGSQSVIVEQVDPSVSVTSGVLIFPTSPNGKWFIPTVTINVNFNAYKHPTVV